MGVGEPGDRRFAGLAVERGHQADGVGVQARRGQGVGHEPLEAVGVGTRAGSDPEHETRRAQHHLRCPAGGHPVGDAHPVGSDPLERAAGGAGASR